MKKILAFLPAAIMSFSLMASSSTPNGFTDDLNAAIESSKKSGKIVYAVFSGSDWCYWCKVLEQGYLSKKDFVKEAEKKLKLVFIDTPRDKSVLSEQARIKNPALVKKYAIRGFPTVMFIKADGTATKASRPGPNMSAKDYAKLLIKEAGELVRKAQSK